MIDRVFAAPKGPELYQGIDFAIANQLDYEMPSFYYVENLDNRDVEMAKYQRLLEHFKGILSMHGPIFDTNVVSLDPEILKVSRKRYIQAIEIAKAMDVQYLVFHSQWTPIYTAANATRVWLDKTTQFWEKMISDHLEGSNLIVVIENFLDQTPETMLKLVHKINSPYLKLCIDTGHINIFSELTPIEWMREVGPQMVYVHAHNNNGFIDSHDAFEKGQLDIDAILKHLNQVPHRVNLAIETSTMKALAQSFELVQSYINTPGVIQDLPVTKSFLI